MVPTQAKRKKTADMPDSPPKRVTRARAAKVPDEAPTKPKPTKITTASTKVAAEKKKAAVSAKVTAPTKTSKRKTRAEDKDVDAAEASEAPAVPEPVLEEQPEIKTTKTKPRQKKAVTAEPEEIQVLEAPKTRGRQPRAEPEAPKTRGRPKTAPGPEPAKAQAKEQKEKKISEPAVKATRGPVAATTARAAPTTGVSKSATAPTKKRVKFEEGHDKENIPVARAAPKKSAMKPTGLSAKPIRKPAAARVTTRGRKATRSGAASENTEKIEQMPLSPKKVSQVAKSDPISEDELAGEKTPVRALSKSPTKRPTSPMKNVGSVSKLDFGQHSVRSSPAKPVSSTVLASPARRPPPSPFKDALKTSPRKLDFGDATVQPVLLSSSRTPMKASLLQESPKRGGFAEKTVKPVLLPSKSPFKASLLQSPARRPNLSPVKLSNAGSPEKSRPGLEASRNATSPSKASPIKAPIFSSEKAVSSPFKAAKSPEQRAKVYVITDDEQSVDVEGDDTPSSPTPSPEKQAEPIDSASAPQDVDDTINDTVLLEYPIFTQQPTFTGLEDDAMASTDISEAPAAFLGPAFSIGSSSLRRISMESESSEDELASPQKIYEITPLKRRGTFAKDLFTPAVIGGQANTYPPTSSLSFTPLADQLNSWDASSPNKQSRPRQTRGMFSFGGVTTTPSIDQAAPGTANASPAKHSFFDDEMAIRDDQNDTSYIEPTMDGENDLAAFKVSLDSQASEEYGDENAAPAELELLRVEQEADNTVTCVPAKVFTPARVIERPREIYTVSKVPLRPSAEDSPLVVPRQRSRSFGGPLAPVIRSRSAQAENVLLEQPTTPVLAPSHAPQTPSSGMRLDAETPGRTVRKGVVPDVLKDAVVHVDVHTTEGADASGIFVDLLTQMGARCVKQWHWNPRAIRGSCLDSTSPQELSPDVTASKVGITHVVYKDGGKRTLEKVRSSNGIVQCVGVGWVLE